MLKISETLSLPKDAVTQTFAIVARKRVGKTYTASVMAEEFIKAKIPIVVLDPTGAWWGLRSSADGKSDGFGVVIIGGSHADVPLDEHAGKIIADLVVDHPGYYVIDFSLTESEAAQDRFATDFGQHFYRRKESAKFPMHLFIDEADCFMPQRPFPGQQRMLGAYDTIVRRGGIRGIGVTMITQRPAVLNKNALSQSETLIALQLSSGIDQDAVDDNWVKRNGSNEQRKVMMDSLASLQKGEAWIWSPSWLGIFKRVNIRERETLNSSATPKIGEKAIIAPKLASVDIEKLGERIKSAAENIKANDPAELKKQLAAAKRDIAKLEQSKPQAAKEVTKTVPALTDTERKRLTKLIESFDYFAKTLDAQTEILNLIRQDMKLPSGVHTEVKYLREFLAVKLTYPTKFSPAPKPLLNPPPPVIQSQRTVVSSNDSSGEFKLGKCERQILIALAQNPQGRNSNQVSILSGYSLTSSGFTNSLSALRTQGFINRDQPIQITPEGLSALGSYDPLPTGQDLIRYWLSKLGKCERMILEVLTNAYPHGLDSQAVSDATGYSVTSSGFTNSLSKLRTLELITRGQPMKASDEFFQ